MQNSIAMANNKISPRRLILCLLLALTASGCDKDKTPAKLLQREPVGQGRGLVKLVLQQADQGTPIPLETIHLVTLIRYTREAQDEGTTSQRWPGDTSGQYRYVETETWSVQLTDFPDGQISLKPATYQFKHNSVTGTPPSGFYGNSDFFEVKAGQAMVVQMTLNAAI